MKRCPHHVRRNPACPICARLQTPMVVNTCPKCRAAMRRWALDWRRIKEPDLKAACLRIAINWRDGLCIHVIASFEEGFEASVMGRKYDRVGPGAYMLKPEFREKGNR